MFKNLLLLIFTVATAQMAFAGDLHLNIVSKGYRLGVLSKCSTPRVPLVPLTKTLECEMHMGKESSQTLFDKGLNKYKNPFAFSGVASQINEMQEYMAKPVVVEYRYFRSNAAAGVNINRKTNYDLVSISNIDKKLPAQSSFEVTARGILEKSHGVRFGRIVKASEKGDFIDSFEIVLQLGTGGTNFFTMSINKRDMYEYAVEVLKSGKTAKFYYVQSSFHLNDTEYNIYKIELADDPWESNQ